MQTTQRSSFRNDIQGLRAFAVISVIIFHLNATWFPAGFLGVDMFFVISGYVVSLSILRSKNQFSWRAFYLGRIKRIAPAYYFLLCVVTLVATFLFIQSDYSWYLDSLKSAIYFYSNDYFANFGDYFAPTANELPLLHTWSLAIEMQFYFLLPLVLIFVSRKYLGVIVVLSVLVLVVVSQVVINSGQNLYFTLWARIPEFLFGVFLTFFSVDKFSKKISNSLAIIGLVLLIIAFYIIPQVVYPGIWLLLPAIGTACLLCSENSFFNRLLGGGLLVFIGALSYSLYLWHWPILSFIRYYQQAYTLSWVATVCFVGILIVFSLVSYYLIENKLRVGSIKRVWMFLIVTVGLLIASLFVGPKINAKVNINLPVSAKRYADPNIICHGKVVGNCTQGVEKDKADVLVIGDSHTAQLNIFYSLIGGRSGLQFKVLSGSSCIPITGFNVSKLPDWAQEACEKQIKVVEKELDHFSVIIIGAYWQWQFEDESTLIALKKFIQKQLESGKEIIIMAQLPVYDGNIQRDMHFQNIGLPSNLGPTPDWQATNTVLKSLADNNKGVALFDVSNASFLQNPVYENELIYHDQSHLNEIGSKMYAEFSHEEFMNVLRDKLERFNRKD